MQTPFAFTHAFLGLLLAVAALACQPDAPASTCPPADPHLLTPEQRAFFDISYGNEFGADFRRLRKWATDIRFVLVGEGPQELLEELDRIVNEINALSQSTRLIPVRDPDEANLLIFWGAKDVYVRDIHPEVAGIAEGNRGFVTISWNADYEIIEGSLCVDVDRIAELECQQHVLREELTQALGLINDASEDSTSIFYDNFSCTTAYSELDRWVIERMLDPRLQPGMCQQDVIPWLE